MPDTIARGGGCVSAQEAARRLGRGRPRGNGYVASCPVPTHGRRRGDLSPSLSLCDGENGRLLYHCLAGTCSQEDVRGELEKLGIIEVRDSYTPSFRPKTQSRPAATTNAKVNGAANGKAPSEKQKPDDWEPVTLDTKGAPDKTPEQVLIDARILERNGSGYLLVQRDADYKVVSKVPVTAIRTFTVRLRDGRPALIDVRIEFGEQADKPRPDGTPRHDKDIRPISLWRHKTTNKLEWRVRQWPKGRIPVYGQEHVRPGDTVVIHEGPPKADLGNEHLPHCRHVSMIGGSGMAAHADWSFLADCTVVGMPDHDKAGKTAMEKVRTIAVEEHGVRSFGVVEWGAGTAEGFGLEDLLRMEVGADDAGVLIDDAIAASVQREKPATVEASPADVTDFETHQDGLALAFAEKYATHLRYCHTKGHWYWWTSSHWQLEKTEMAFSWSRDLCREAYAEIENLKLRGMIASVATARAVEAFARADRRFKMTSDDWDKDDFLLGTPGGTVDLKTGILRPADPTDGITKVTSVAPAPPNTPAPTWETFLHDATRGDKALQRFMQQIAGYCLTGDVTEECLFFVHGPGGNGKGVFLRVLGTILGTYAEAAAMDTFTAGRGDKHPTDLAKLAGARMVTASETEEGRAWAESRIKELTGNERPVSARFMRQDFFEYTPKFKLLIVGNHKPILKNPDDAMRRRFHLIPFIHKPQVVDRKLKVKMQAEYPAILRWMIDGCLDWQKNGLVPPAVVQEATQEYFDSQDVFGQWAREWLEVEEGNKNKWEWCSDLYASWVEFCGTHGEEPGKERDLGVKLTRLGAGKSTKRRFGPAQAIRTGVRLIRPTNATPPQEDDSNVTDG